MPASNKLCQRLFDLYGDALLLEGCVDTTPRVSRSLLIQSLSHYRDSLVALDRFVATAVIRPAHITMLEEMRLPLDQVLTLDLDTDITHDARVAIHRAGHLLRHAIAGIMDPDALECAVSKE